MKVFIVLCVLVAAATGQLEDLVNHLAAAEVRFQNALQTDGVNPINVALNDLAAALAIGRNLVTNDAASVDEVADVILGALMTFMNGASSAPGIQKFNQVVYESGQLPFPPKLTAMFQDITDAMNSRVSGICASFAAAAPPVADGA